MVVKIKRSTPHVGLLALLVFLFVFCCFLLAADVRGSSPEFDQARFEKMVASVDAFERKLHGCPEKGYPPEIECRDGRGEFDVKLYLKMMDQGHAYFKEK